MERKKLFSQIGILLASTLFGVTVLSSGVTELVSNVFDNSANINEKAEEEEFNLPELSPKKAVTYTDDVYWMIVDDYDNPYATSKLLKFYNHQPSDWWDVESNCRGTFNTRSTVTWYNDWEKDSAIQSKYGYVANTSWNSVEFVDSITPEYMDFWFCTSSLTTIKNLNNLNASGCKSMKGMFERCWQLASIDLSTLNTSSVTDMSYLFEQDTNLKTINIGGSFSTASCTDLSHMFNYVSIEVLNLSNFNTSNVTSYVGMFNQDPYHPGHIDILDISSFTIKSGADVSSMFDTSLTVKRLKVKKELGVSLASTNFFLNNQTFYTSLASDATGYTTSAQMASYANTVAAGTTIDYYVRMAITVDRRVDYYNKIDTISRNCAYGDVFTLPSADQTLAHSAYGGLFTDQNLQTAYNTAITANKTLHAKFTPDTYNINYYDEDGEAYSGNAIDSSYKKHSYGIATTLPTGTKKGYSFEGWFTDSDCTSGNEITTLGATAYEDDIDLYAKWTARTYNIVYRDKTSYSFTGTMDSGYPTTHTYDESTTLFTPTKTGYNFGGWYYDDYYCTNSSKLITGNVIPANSSLFDSEWQLVFYAKWTPKEFTITYKDEGGVAFSGTLAPSSPTKHTYDKVTTLKNPTKTDYVFVGWYTDSACTEANKVTALGKTSFTDNITLYAKWLREYSISYYDAGGAAFSGTHGASYPTKHSYGTDTTLVNPTKTDYKFLGWYTDSACTEANKVTKLGATDYSADITLYAKWAGPGVTIYIIDGCSGNYDGTFPTTFYPGADTELLPLTKTGYTFVGWYPYSTRLDSDKFVNNVIPASYSTTDTSICLFAKFEIINYSITINYDGGSVTTANKTTYTVEDSTFTLVNPTKTGNTFDGYSGTDITGTSSAVEIVKGSTGDRTYTATYTPEWYWINYKNTDGTGYTDGFTATQPTIHTYGTATTLVSGQRTGSNFIGFYLDSACTQPVTSLGATDFVGGDYIDDGINVYLKFEKINYNINVKEEDGSAFLGTHGAGWTGTFHYDEIVTLDTPTRTGYDFKGYYWSNAFTPGTSITGWTAYMYTSDQTVYVQWEPKEYTITYEYMDGATHGASHPTTHTYDTATTLVNPSKTGYTFKGWHTSSSCSNESKVTTLGATDYTSDITLYAKWDVLTYSITYLDVGGATCTAEENTSPTSHVYNVTTTLVDASKTGYTFNGWYSDITGDTLLTEISANSYSADITLYAKWTANVYDISYEYMDGATHGASHPTTHTYDTATTLVDPTKTGYTFKGWHTSSSCSNESKVTTLGATDYLDDITLYAKWEVQVYNLTYLDQGTQPFSGVLGTDSPNTHTYNTVTTLVTPTRSGYGFLGWYLGSDCSGTPITQINETDLTTDHNVYAKWTPIYTITYLDEGGQPFSATSGVSDLPVEYWKALGTDIGTVYKTGFSTEGWYTNPTCGSAYKVTTLEADIYSANITLYAKWQVGVYDITYKDNGDAAFSGVHGASHPTTHTYDTATTLVDPTKTGYSFKGWYETSDCSGTKVTSIGANTKTVPFTLYAKWEANTYSISYYDKNDAAFSGVHGASYPTTHTYDTATTLVSASKTGYTFLGWYASSTLNGSPISSIGATERTADIKLYAKWEANSYTITYKDNGDAAFSGDNNTSPVTHTYNAATTLVNPAKHGYDFLGWYEASDCSGTKVTSIGANTITADITLYAKWSPSVYNITYKDEGNVAFSGAHGASYPTTHTYDTATTLVNPTKTGYNFAGWFDNYRCDGEAITSISANSISSDITFYAKWEEKDAISIDETQTISETYSGSSVIYTIQGDDSALSGFTVEYCSPGTSWTTTAPVNAGTYSVRVTRNEDNTYKAYSNVFNYIISIAKANASITVDTTAITKTYDGQGVTPRTATSNFGTVSCDKTSSDLVNAGQYVITYTVTGNDNYNGDTKTLVVTINKGQAVITVDTTPIVKTYNGQNITLPVATSNFGTVNCNYDVIMTAGTYTLLYDVSETNNYYGDHKSVNVTVNKATYNMDNVSWNYTDAFLYDGETHTVVLNNLPQGVNPTYTGNSQTNCGDYHATVTFTYDANNYNEPSFTGLDWSIKPRIITPEEPVVSGEETVNAEVEAQEGKGFSNDITVVVEVTVEVDVETKELTIDYYKIEDKETKLDWNEKVGVIFDVKLIQTVDGVETEIKEVSQIGLEKIKVRMQIPESVDISKVVKLLHVHSADDVEVIDFDASKVDENRYYEIEIDRLSEFAFVYDAGGLPIWAIILLSALGLGLIAFLIIFLLRRREDNDDNDDSGKKAAAGAASLSAITAIALGINGNKDITKKSIAKYLKDEYAKEVEVNERPNYTAPNAKNGKKLLLADTHYIKLEKKNKSCFVFVYEPEDGACFMIAKTNEELVKKYKKDHKHIALSAFPKSKDTWYTFIFDETYTLSKVYNLIDELLGKDPKNALLEPIDNGGEAVSLKTLTALAGAVSGNKEISKKTIASYLRNEYGKEVELNERANYTAPNAKNGKSLLLADTHYIKLDKKNKTCFLFVYEQDEGATFMIAKTNEELVKKYKKDHKHISLSAFPKSSETWYTFVFDESYSLISVCNLLDELLGKEPKNFAVAETPKAPVKKEEKAPVEEEAENSKKKLNNPEVKKESEQKEEAEEDIPAASLTDSFTAAKKSGSSKNVNKKLIADFLKSKYDYVKVNERENYTAENEKNHMKLMLPDTHYYVKGGKNECFVFVYEPKDSATFILAKTSKEVAKKYKKDHKHIAKSLFPKSAEPWYRFVFDDSYDKSDVFELLADILKER